jgi:site-specific recombinase XerD
MATPPTSLWQRFITDRKILRGVSSETLRYYRWVHRAFEPILDAPTKDGMMGCIEKLLADGVSATSCNTYLRGLKSYVRWLHAEGHLAAPLKITFLKTGEKLLTVLSQAQIDLLLAYKPVGSTASRTHVACLLAIDCGLRCAELLGLRHDHIDWDGCVLRVHGKGNKWRAVPFSESMRRILYKYCRDRNGSKLVFGTKNGTKFGIRNFDATYWRWEGLSAFRDTSIRTCCGIPSAPATYVLAEV